MSEYIYINYKHSAIKNGTQNNREAHAPEPHGGLI
jgi:hypothetical protein